MTVLSEDLVQAGIYTVPPTSPCMTGTRTNLLRWLSTTTNPDNCAPSIASIAAPAFQDNFVKGIGTPRNFQKGATIDHAFEKNWIQGYFE